MLILACFLVSCAIPFAMQCFAVDQYPTYWVGDHDHVSGVHKMKAEIYQRDVIGCTCGIAVTHKFGAYTGGIFSNSTSSAMLNEVSVSRCSSVMMHSGLVGALSHSVIVLWMQHTFSREVVKQNAQKLIHKCGF